MRIVIHWFGVLLAAVPLHAQAVDRSFQTERIGQFAGHGNDFDSMTFHPVGSEMLSVGDGGDLILWDAETWTEKRRFDAVHQYTGRIAFHPTRPLAIVLGSGGAADGAVVVDFETGKRRVLVGPRAIGVAISAGGVVAIARMKDGQHELRILPDIDADESTHRRLELPGARTPSELFFLGDGSTLYLGSNAESWMLDVGDPEARFESANGVIGFALGGAAVTYEKGQLVCGEFRSNRRYRSNIAVGPRGAPVAYLRGDIAHDAVLVGPEPEVVGQWHAGFFTRIAVSPDGTVAAADSDGVCHVFDGERRHLLGGHAGPVRELVFSADGQFVAATGRGATVVARADGSVFRRFGGPVAFTVGAQGPEFVLLDPWTCRRWNASTDTTHDETKIPQGWRPEPGWGLWYNSNVGLRRLVNCGEFGVTLRDAVGPKSRRSVVFDWIERTMRKLQPLAGPKLSHSLDTTQMVWSAARRELVLAQATPPYTSGTPYIGKEFFGALCAYDETGAPVGSKPFQHDVLSVAVSPDGQWLLAATEKGVHLLDAESFEQAAKLELADVQWMDFLSEELVLAHDGNRTLSLRLPDLAQARVELPDFPYPKPEDRERSAFGRVAGITAATLSPRRDRLALAVGADVFVYRVLR